MDDPKAPIPPGSTLTAILTGAADDGGAGIALPDGQWWPLPAGAVLVAGDILPVIREALETAMRFWEPSDEIEDCPACGPVDALGALCSDHAANRVKSDRYRDVLMRLGGGE
jgi:hypothetical protein